MGLQRSLPGTRDRVIAKRPGRAKPGRQGKGKEKAKDVGAEAVLVEVKRGSSERSHYKQAFVVKWEVLKYQTVPLPIIRFCLLPSACLLDQPYIMPPQESQWSRLHPQTLVIRFDPDVKSRAPV
ncbi:hypothetical protein JCM8202v2_002116 [Rhodotorula sphaerocarpa]